LGLGIGLGQGSNVGQKATIEEALGIVGRLEAYESAICLPGIPGMN